MTLNDLIARLQLVRAQYGGDIAAWEAVGSPPLSVEVRDMHSAHARPSDKPEKVVMLG